MSDNYIIQNLKLKMGFFETKKYKLLINEKLMKLIPLNRDNNKPVIINLSDVKTIIVSRGIPVEIEIRTAKETYIGTFPKTEDISGTVTLLKIVLKEDFFIN